MSWKCDTRQGYHLSRCPKFRVQRFQNTLDNRVRNVPIVGIRLVAALIIFIQPSPPLDQTFVKSLPHCIARTFDRRIILTGKVILHHDPGEFMRKFESLNQAPLFKIGKRSLTGEVYSFIESRKRDSIFGKALYPANIRIDQNDEPPRSLRRRSA